MQRSQQRKRRRKRRRSTPPPRYVSMQLQDTPSERGTAPSSRRADFAGWPMPMPTLRAAEDGRRCVLSRWAGDRHVAPQRQCLRLRHLRLRRCPRCSPQRRWRTATRTVADGSQARLLERSWTRRRERSGSTKESSGRSGGKRSGDARRDISSDRRLWAPLPCQVLRLCFLGLRRRAASFRGSSRSTERAIMTRSRSSS
jgi:hypothetical protein